MLPKADSIQRGMTKPTLISWLRRVRWHHLLGVSGHRELRADFLEDQQHELTPRVVDCGGIR